VCAEAAPCPGRDSATRERDRLEKGRGRLLVDPLAVTDEHVLGLDGEQPPRRCQPEERRDAKLLSRRAVVLGGADRVGADERPLLRVPDRDLMPPAAPQERQDLERRPCRSSRCTTPAGSPNSRARSRARSSATGSMTQTRPSDATACEARCMKRGLGVMQRPAWPAVST
jgi:hypothetical protein